MRLAILGAAGSACPSSTEPGPGGIAYGLRTVPVAVHVAERVAAVCPGAWVINVANPAGLVTEAMQQVLGDRVIGICDSPAGLGRRAAVALRLDPDRTRLDYVGLAALQGFEEGRLFGLEWIQSLGCLPNEYLYYYFLRDAADVRVAATRASRWRSWRPSPTTCRRP